MTEAEWLACGNPEPMLEFLRGRLSERRWRLFDCAVARLLPSLEDPAQDQERARAVATAELFADAGVSKKQLKRAARCSGGEGFWTVAHTDAFEAAEYSIADSYLVDRQGELAGLLRDIAGNPFRDPCVAAWRTPDVLALARAIYDEHGFERLPILGDALEEAGCADADVLGHCRGPGPHVRGCWVLDLLLEKS